MKFLEEDSFFLKIIEETDVGENYLNWMNDYEIVKYTESRFFPHSISSLNEYVKNVNNQSNVMFAIIDKKTNNHIGNIKLGNINQFHKFADIGIIIGQKEFWNKGIGSKAIYLVVNYAFSRLNLRKVFAGIYENNIGSIKAFEKCGFKKSFVEKDKYFFEGEYIDAIIYEKYNSNYK